MAPRLLERALSHFAPAELGRNDEAARSTRNIVLFALSGAVASLLYGILFMVVGMPRSAGACAFDAGAMVAALLVLRATSSRGWATSVGVGGSYLGLLTITV